MKIEDLSPGMLIRLADDVSESVKILGGGSQKRSMAGRILEINKVIENKDAVLISGFRFLLSDIVEVINQYFPNADASDFLYNNISELKTGMSIRLAPNVERSVSKFGGGSTKRNMAGSIRVIRRIRKVKNAAVVPDDNGTSWTYDLSDIRRVIPLEKRKRKKRNLFDPKELVL